MELRDLWRGRVARKRYTPGLLTTVCVEEIFSLCRSQNQWLFNLVWTQMHESCKPKCSGRFSLCFWLMLSVCCTLVRLSPNCSMCWLLHAVITNGGPVSQYCLTLKIGNTHTPNHICDIDFETRLWGWGRLSNRFRRFSFGRSCILTTHTI